ncbi:unnamed protein product [Prunus armeniaca]|uniref:Inhibitor I9 domain-containing protein n=1 Tax=Prunus armeniaca TaxID=36596 RepID=A0A6J5Y7D2_PRUAR|nr:unnamed protein product [Prunus armeniaca]
MAAEARFWFAALLLLVTCLSAMAKQTYIVQMNHHSKPSSYATHHDWYSAHLQSLSSTEDSLLYTYTTAYHGFAASLDSEQAELLRQSDSVLGVYEDTLYTLHTTRTPEFLGLEIESGLWAGHSTQDLNQASNDVIVGVLDTGVWPESKSFDDAGMPEIPTRWRGQCESGSDFAPSLCNRKLIGARCFSKGFHMASGGSFMRKSKEAESPRDRDGHGTHTQQHRRRVPRGQRQPPRLRDRDGAWDGASREGRRVQGLLEHRMFRVGHSGGHGSGHCGRRRRVVALFGRWVLSVLPRHDRDWGVHGYGEGHFCLLLCREQWAE